MTIASNSLKIPSELKTQVLLQQSSLSNKLIEGGLLIAGKLAKIVLQQEKSWNTAASKAYFAEININSFSK